MILLLYIDYLETHGRPLVVVPAVAPDVQHEVEKARAPKHLPPGPVGHP